MVGSGAMGALQNPSTWPSTPLSVVDELGIDDRTQSGQTNPATANPAITLRASQPCGAPTSSAPPLGLPAFAMEHIMHTPALAHTPTSASSRTHDTRAPRQRATTPLATLALVGCIAMFQAHADDTALADDIRPTLASVALPGDRVFPESVTAAADGTLYVGSIGRGGIFRIAPGSDTAEPWIAPGAFDTRSTFGLLADERAGLLWVCSNDITSIGVQVAGTQTGSWLKGFDLATGEGKVSVPFPNTPSLCNEITVAPDGGVYVTNTLAPEILRLSDDRKALEVWATGSDLPQPDEGPGLDGLAFGADGHLYVNSYGKGELFRVSVDDGKAGKVTRLTTNRALVMPDTLRLIDGTTFLMVEGGGRLDRVSIAGDHATVETLAQGFALPTSLAVAGDVVWVTEGQLDYVFDAAKKGQTPSLPFKLFAVPLTAKDEAR